MASSRKLKKGQKVKIKSCEQIKKLGHHASACFVSSMEIYCGKIVTIVYLNDLANWFKIKEDEDAFWWSIDMVDLIVMDDEYDIE